MYRICVEFLYCSINTCMIVVHYKCLKKRLSLKLKNNFKIQAYIYIYLFLILFFRCEVAVFVQGHGIIILVGLD